MIVGRTVVPAPFAAGAFIVASLFGINAVFAGCIGDCQRAYDQLVADTKARIAACGRNGDCDLGPGPEIKRRAIFGAMSGQIPDCSSPQSEELFRAVAEKASMPPLVGLMDAHHTRDVLPTQLRDVVGDPQAPECIATAFWGTSTTAVSYGFRLDENRRLVMTVSWFSPR